MSPTRCSLVFVCALAVGSAPTRAQPAVETTPALRSWEQGQALMNDSRFDDAILCYYQSLRLDPTLSRNFLSLAAAFVAQGEETKAAPWMARYLEAEPKHVIIRLHYANMLLRLNRSPDAQTQLERFIADAQGRDDIAIAHLVTCHTRLMELAEKADDSYLEHLHRGIGLYLLVRTVTLVPEADGAGSEEALLCRAAAELSLAHARRPAEARPCWYLHQVWTRLAQQHPAVRWLCAADEAAPFSFLTPTERRDLQHASGRTSLLSSIK